MFEEAVHVLDFNHLPVIQGERAGVFAKDLVTMVIYPKHLVFRDAVVERFKGKGQMAIVGCKAPRF